MSVDIDAWAQGARGRLLAGKYRLLELLGRGGMGAVFVAEDLALGRQVAVKVMRPSRRGAGGVERFRREARAAARVGGDGVVQVLEFDFDGELGPFQVLELLEGESLAARLKRGPMPPPESIGLALELARTLERVHAESIVHRDIKPANVFLEHTPEGRTRVKLLDFGVARIGEQAELTVPGARIGTPGFMAPEQLRGASVGPAADIYALGVLMHTCLAGEPPFAGIADAMIATATMSGELPRLTDRAPWLSVELRTLVDDASAIEADERPTASALVARLGALYSTPLSGPPAPRSTPPPRALASTLMSEDEPRSAPYTIPDTADPAPSPGTDASHGAEIPAAIRRPASAPPERGGPVNPTPSPRPPRARRRVYAAGCGLLAVVFVGGLAGGWELWGDDPERRASPADERPPRQTSPEPLATPPEPERTAPEPAEEAPEEDPHLVAIRQDAAAGEAALAAGQIESAIRSFERARDQLSTLSIGVDRAIGRSVYLGLGDAHLAAIERDAPLGLPAYCMERVAGHQVAAGTAYQRLHGLGDADIAQLAQMRRGQLYERLGELCGTRNGAPVVRNAYLRAAAIEYEAAATADGPRRPEAQRRLARVRATMR